MIKSIRLYFLFVKMHLKSMMSHKTSFFLNTMGQFLVSFNVFLGVYFMMSRFHQVKGFTYEEILLCFALFLLAFTVAETVFRSLDTFNHIIGNGEFDRILVRPHNPVYLVLCSKVELARMGRFLQALVMLVYAVKTGTVVWTPGRIMAACLMVICGTVVFAAIYLIFASICFFTLEGLEFMNVFTDGAREYGKYPIGVYGKTMLTICTYVVPFALFQYYPFLYIIGRADHDWYALLPLLSCLFLVPAVLLWNYGLTHYQSTGS